MRLKAFQITQINHWYTYTISLDDNVYDVIVINYTDMKLNLIFKFKRFKGLAFFETFLDYAETYTSDIEFRELKYQLSNMVPYLDLFNRIEELDYDGI